MSNAILTRIASKFQVTVPPEIRAIFALQEGDMFQWIFDASTGRLQLVPKRAQLLTPLTAQAIAASREQRAQAKQASKPGKKQIAAHAG